MSILGLDTARGKKIQGILEAVVEKKDEPRCTEDRTMSGHNGI
jgi:hypothetical protein